MNVGIQRGLVRATILILLASLLTACGGSNQLLTAGAWPGIAVSEDTIFLANGPHVYAINQNGLELWRYPERQERNRQFFAVPVLDEDQLIVSDYQDAVTSLDVETGQANWVFNAGGARFIGGAIVVGDSVYAAAVNGALYSLDKDNGSLIWRFDTDREIWSTPAYADRTIYITSLDRHVYAVDAITGELVWQFPEVGQEIGDPPIGAMVSTPAIYEDSVYFGSFNYRLYALDRQTENIQWTVELSNWLFGSPLVVEDVGLLIAADLDGKVFAVDLETGDEVWSFQAHGPVVGTPVLAEEEGQEVIYFTSGDTHLYVLTVSDGEAVRPPVEIKNVFTTRFLFFPMGDDERPVPIYAPPVLFQDDTVLIGSHQGNKMLIALDRETLVPTWTYTPG